MSFSTFRFIADSRVRRACTKSAGAFLWGATAIILCCLVLATGCALSGRATANQQQGQTRPRRSADSDTGTPNANDKNSNQMSEVNTATPNDAQGAPFYPALDKALARRGRTLAALCDTNNPVARRVLEDYGAMFLAAANVLPPPVCVFESEDAVSRFQNEAKFASAVIGGDRIELQPAAMEALLAARKEARDAGLDITPRGGTEAARRDYADTSRLWATRFLPALNYWQKRGRLSKEQVQRLRALPLTRQVEEVLELEKSGIYFSKDFSKSILYSIAAPGTSQHIAMLALDVAQFGNARVRRLLARHGWFQTVKSDLPHFTYLGVAEEDLPALGLRKVMSGAQEFWIPNVNE